MTAVWLRRSDKHVCWAIFVRRFAVNVVTNSNINLIRTGLLNGYGKNDNWTNRFTMFNHNQRDARHVFVTSLASCGFLQSLIHVAWISISSESYSLP